MHMAAQQVGGLRTAAHRHDQVAIFPAQTIGDGREARQGAAGVAGSNGSVSASSTELDV